MARLKKDDGLPTPRQGGNLVFPHDQARISGLAFRTQHLQRLQKPHP